MHAVQAAAITESDTVVVLGAGTLGLCTVAAVRRTGASQAAILAGMPTMWLLSPLVT